MRNHDTNHILVPQSSDVLTGAQTITVADAVVIVLSWKDLPKKRRGALASSLRSIARIAGTGPAMMPLTPAELNLNVLNRAPELYGISASAMSTVRSNVRHVMRRLGLLSVPAKLSPPWAEFRDGLPERARASLARFIQYHSISGILPAAVCDASFETCQAWIQTATTCRNQSRLVSQMRYRWNIVARERSDLGLAILGAAQCRVLGTVSFAEMHPELQADLMRLRIHFASNDLDDFLDNDLAIEPAKNLCRSSAPRRPQRPITVTERIRYVRQAIWALLQTGIPLETIASINQLVCPLDNAKAIIRFMWQRAGNERSASAGHIAEILRQLAKYHALLPDADVMQLARIKRRVCLEHDGMTETNQRRLDALLAPDAQQRLLALPSVLMAEAHRLLPNAPLRAVSTAKRALMVHLEIFYLFRISNLVGMRADRHFVYDGQLKRKIVRFMIPGSEMKYGTRHELPVHQVTNDYIAAWMTKFRHHICARDNPFLLPGIGTRSMTRQAAAASIKKIVAERVGCEINPHLFRHRGAVTYLIKHGSDAEAARWMLGHKSSSTIHKYYLGPERDAAVNRFDDSVLDDMHFAERVATAKHRRVSKKLRAGTTIGAVTSSPKHPRIGEDGVYLKRRING